jgi:hypothetical protein
MTLLDTIADPALVSFSDTALNPGDSVTYMVKASNSAGDAADSNIPPAVVAAAVPDPITDLALTVISAIQVDLSWSTPADNGSPLTQFLISRDLNGGGMTLLDTIADGMMVFLPTLRLVLRMERDSVQ